MGDPILLLLGIASLLFLIIVYFVWRSATMEKWILTSRMEKEEWKRLDEERTRKEKKIGKKKMRRKVKKK